MKHYQIFKLRAVLLLFALLCSMPNVWADNSGTIEGYDITWNYISSTKTLTISGTGEMPDFYQVECPWTDISDIQTVIITTGITSIGKYCFYNLQQLSSVTIPNSVLNIYENAFDNCTNLRSIVIPNCVKRIYFQAFYRCTQLTSVILSENLERIEQEAFRNCSSLKKISIPSSVTYLAWDAFTECKNVTDIFNYANLDALYENSTSIFSEVSFKLNKETICHVYDKAAWENKYPLANVTFVGDLDNPQYISGNNGPKWYYNGSSGSLTISGEGNMYSFGATEGTPWINKDVETITIESGVTSIGDYAFKNTGVETVDISSTVTSIGAHAFESCTSLASVEIPEGVETIKTYAFKGCTALETVTLPSSLTTIETGAFVDCEAVDDVYCYANPSNMTWTDSNIGFKASKATNFHVENATAWTESYPDANVIYIQDIGKQYISGDSGPMWEYDDTSKEIVISGEGDIPSFETTDTPWKNADIESITIAEGVTSIGDYAFKNTGVETVDISSTVTSIGAHAFESCTSLASIVIPQGVKTIKTYAFKGCTALKTVTLPSSLTTIETGAFVDCEAVDDVYCYANPSNMTWTDSNIGFKASKATNFHVENATVWTESYPDANVTYAQDIGKQYISGDSGPMWEYDDTSKEIVISGEGDIPSFETTDDTPWKDADVETITIEEGVTSIGDYAFKNMDVQSVSISKTVKFIGKGAFYGCSKLASLSLPEGVETIKESAFSGCPAIATVVLPSSLSVIQSMAFNGCTGVNHAYCHASPSTLTWTDNNVGFKDSKATSFHIANLTTWETNFPEANVTFVDDQEDSWTEKKYVYGTSGPMWQINNTTKTMIISGTGAMYSYFDDNKNLAPWSNNDFERVIINEGVTKIGQYSFYNSENLTSVSVPSSVTCIGEYNQEIKGETNVEIIPVIA